MQFFDDLWFSDSENNNKEDFNGQKEDAYEVQQSAQKHKADARQVLTPYRVATTSTQLKKEYQSVGKTLQTDISRGKYIRKLKEILPQEELPRLAPTIEQDASTGKRKPRQHAKSTRQRKKLYVKMMEQRKETLKKQLERKKKEIEEASNHLKKAQNQNNTIAHFTSQRFGLIKQLQSMVALYESASAKQDLSEMECINNEINQLLDFLRDRVGATGKERIQVIDEYFGQVVSLSLPAIHRYLMWSAQQATHFFADQATPSPKTEVEQDLWFNELKDGLSLNQHQLQQMLKKRQLFIAQKHKLMTLIDRLRQVKQTIYTKSIEFETVVERVRHVLTPIQCAHFCLFIEKNKYRKQLNLCEITAKDQQIRGIQGRKIVKKN